MKTTVSRTQLIWDVARQQRQFTVLDIRKQLTEIDIYFIQERCKHFTQHGFFKVLNDNDVDNIKYGMQYDPGPKCPWITLDGQCLIAGKKQAYLWRTIRILKQFTASELAFSASTHSVEVKESYARQYICQLSRAGYFIVTNKNRMRGEHKRYRLVNAFNTGSVAPTIRKNGIFDYNKRKLFKWSVSNDD